MVWLSIGPRTLPVLVMELIVSGNRHRLLLTAIVGLITMVAIIGMLSWWILPRYTTYNDPPPSYPSLMSS